MRDPFKQNTQSQLIREAQFAFIVIGLLLCVLVYVAFHRVSGRKFHFRQIAQSAPVAQQVDGVAYPAQAIIEHESKAIPQAFSGIQEMAQPKQMPVKQIPVKQMPVTQVPNKVSAFSFPVKKLSTPPANIVKTQPVGNSFTVKEAPVVPKPEVAQANYTAPAPVKVVDDPFANIKPIVPVTKRSLSKPDVVPQPSISEFTPKVNSETRLKTPEIKSNFGEGSTRELTTFEKQYADLKRKQPKPKVTPSQPVVSRSSDFMPVLKRAPSKPEPSDLSPFVVETKTPTPKQPPAPLVAETAKQGSADIDTQTYTSQPTDSLWSIATEQYGDGRFFRALHEHNRERIASADKLQPQTKINVPDAAVLLKQYPSLCPADLLPADAKPQGERVARYEAYEHRLDERFHVTESGDTLFDVARQRLGQASRYLEIHELNRFRIPEQVDHLTPLKPGLRLLLPE